MTKTKPIEFVYICTFCKVKGFSSRDAEWVRCWRCNNQAVQVKVNFMTSGHSKCVRCNDDIQLSHDKRYGRFIRVCQPCTSAVQHETYIELSQIAWNVEEKLWPVVYFLQPIQGGHIKIGSTNKFYKRFRRIQAQSPQILNVTLMLDGTKALEESLHNKFRRHRLHYEWFADHQEILDFIDYTTCCGSEKNLMRV